MSNKFLIAGVFFLLSCLSLIAQENDANKSSENPIIETDATVVYREPINPLSPARAAFYSAILPGLGQAYNKKYWKIPIVFGALGTSIFIYIDNNKNYNRYRDAYKSRLAGYETDEFYGKITDDGLQRAQKLFRKNKELSLLVIMGIYALNIIDANVDAHLLQYNVDKNLSLSPHFKLNEFDKTNNLGLTLNFKF